MFDGMPAADYYKVRGALCSCILSTDFSRHRTFLDAARAHGKALKAARGGDAPPGPHDVGWECQLLLKCADISNPAKRLPVACSWALRVTDEFYMQVATCPSRAAPSCQARGGAPAAGGRRPREGAARRAQRGAARGAGRRGALARDAGVAQLRPRGQDAGGDPAGVLSPPPPPPPSPVAPTYIPTVHSRGGVRFSDHLVRPFFEACAALYPSTFRPWVRQIRKNRAFFEVPPPSY